MSTPPKKQTLEALLSHTQLHLMLNLTQQVRATERKLQDLTQCEKSLEIPGNFRAQQRRVKHDNSRLVFPEKKGRGNENYETHYSLNFKPRPDCKPLERPCSPTRRNNPHPSKVSERFCYFFANLGIFCSMNESMISLNKKFLN